MTLVACSSEDPNYLSDSEADGLFELCVEHPNAEFTDCDSLVYRMVRDRINDGLVEKTCYVRGFKELLTKLPKYSDSTSESLHKVRWLARMEERCEEALNS